MEKAEVKRKTLQFKNDKNECLLTVRSRSERKYSGKLKADFK